MYTLTTLTKIQIYKIQKKNLVRLLVLKKYRLHQIRHEINDFWPNPVKIGVEFEKKCTLTSARPVNISRCRIMLN